MKPAKRALIIRLAKAGYDINDIVPVVDCSHQIVEGVLEDAGLNIEKLEAEISRCARKLGWNDKIDGLTDDLFAWAEGLVADDEADPKVKLQLFKLLLEHRPDHYFSKSAKLQVDVHKEQPLLGGNRILELRRLASAPAEVVGEVVNG